jgi:hypothetical protein
MSNKAFSLVSGSCNAATRCSIFNAWLFDEDVLFELLVCCCCAACAAIIIACTNRPIDWKHFDALCAKSFSNTSRTNIDRIRAEFSSKHKRRSHDSFTTKEYKSVRRRRSLPSLLLLLLSSRKVVRLSFTYDVEITFGETSRANFPQKKRALCSLLRCFCRCLTNGGGV